MATLHAFPALSTALDMLDEVSRFVPVSSLDSPTPCSDWTVAQVLQHAAGDQLAWASFVGGTPMPSCDPFAPSGRLDTSAADVVGAALGNAVTAWSTVPADATSVPTPLPQGAMTAHDAAAACAIDAGIHSWDIAVALGLPSPLTDELAQALMPVALAIVEPLRQWGAYAPALPEQPGDAAAQRLLRYLGRDPQWSA